MTLFGLILLEAIDYAGMLEILGKPASFPTWFIQNCEGFNADVDLIQSRPSEDSDSAPCVGGR
jgi:hypothetical protein